MHRLFYKLRVRFSECELSQSEVARKIGLSPSSFCSRMTGRLPFNLNEVRSICDVLDIAPQDAYKYFFE